MITTDRVESLMAAADPYASTPTPAPSFADDVHAALTWDTANPFTKTKPCGNRKRMLIGAVGVAGTSQPRLTSRRHLTVAASAVVAVAAAAVIVTGVLPGDSPGGPSAANAATLERLARTAAGGGGVGPHQFAYALRIGLGRDVGNTAKASPGPGAPQNAGSPTPTASGDQRTTRETWSAPNGEDWYRQTGEHGPPCWHDVFPTPADFAIPTAAFLRALPTDPDRLRDYMRSHVSGSTSTDEAVFEAVDDLMRSGLPSPTLRATAFRVLEETGHVTVHADARDALGRSAIQVDFMDQQRRPNEVQSLFFDPKTSRVIQEQRMYDGTVSDRSVTVRSATVASVPASVRACPTNTP